MNIGGDYFLFLPLQNYKILKNKFKVLVHVIFSESSCNKQYYYSKILEVLKILHASIPKISLQQLVCDSDDIQKV